MSQGVVNLSVLARRNAAISGERLSIELGTRMCIEGRFTSRRAAVLQCVAVRCSVLQCVAVCCSVLQCVAVCCSVLQCHLGAQLLKTRKSCCWTFHNRQCKSTKVSFIFHFFFSFTSRRAFPSLENPSKSELTLFHIQGGEDSQVFCRSHFSQKSPMISGSFAKMTCTFRQGWVWCEGTCEFSGIQFTKHFIEFVFVETNEVVRSNSNVILTRQNCGQRSSRVAASKRRVLACYFSVRI